MEKAKDGVTLIADAIRAEIAQAEKAKQTATPPVNNVIDVTAQFTTTPPATPATPDETSNAGNDDGTMYKNE